MRYFLRPVDSEGGAAELVGPFVTFDLSEKKVSGYPTMGDYQAHQTIRVATFHAGRGWKVVDREGFWKDLEVVVREA
jgi:hypothetical protein